MTSLDPDVRPTDPLADVLVAPLPAAPGDALFMVYASAGGGRTGVIRADASALVLRDVGFDAGWIHVVALGRGRVAFQSNLSPFFAVGEIGPDGTYADVHNNTGVAFPHQLVRVFDDTLLSYTVRSAPGGVYAGTAVVGRVGTDGRYTVISEPLLWDFWTHIVPVGNGNVLFYNGYSRMAAGGRFTGDGGYADLQNYVGFDPWTQIVASSDGTLLFYDSSSGNAASGRIEPDGSFANLHSAFMGFGRWFQPTMDGRMLVFRSNDVLIASFGGPNGWFSDARLVHLPANPPGKIFGRPLFVR